jgi:GTP cyclohydrolase IA
MPRSYIVGEVMDAITTIIAAIGDDPKRDGLQETPTRVMNSWCEIFSGYGKDPRDMLTTFENDGYDQMVILTDVEFYSTCEHHMLPFFGKAHIAYIPTKGKVVGISKLARLLEVYTRRLQIQERIGEQVTKALMEHLQPEGAACILEATHFCMTCRGVNKQHSKMVTSSLKGSFLTQPEARQELLTLIRR